MRPTGSIASVFDSPVAVLRALPAMFRVATAQLSAYRAEILIWILSATMPLVMLALWDAVAEGGPVAGLNQGDMARYFTVTLVARQIMSAWLSWELNPLIRTGGLSPHLLRPLSPIWYYLVQHLTHIPLRALVLVPLVAALVLWRPEMGLQTEPSRLLAFSVACMLGFLLNFLSHVFFGALAFWTGQSQGLFMAWFGLWSLLGGYLMPLRLMPEWVGTLNAYLPFRAMLSVPIEIGAGLLPASEWLAALGHQCLWVLAFALIAIGTWQRGLRRYEAFGA